MKKLKTIAVLPGDGIGPEVVAQAIKVLEAIEVKFGHSFEYKTGLIGAAALDKTGEALPAETLALCKSTDAVLLGAIGDPKYDDPTIKKRPEQGLLALRRELSVFANIRPVETFAKLARLSPLKEELVKDVDFVIYRELTSGIYFGEKGTGSSESGDFAFDECRYTTSEIERIATLAFNSAMRRNKKLTLVDKANVLETSRLWRSTVASMAHRYPDVELNFLYVDNAAMQLIINPKQFDVILCPNLFGDIISDEASVIAGSLGLLPSASLGEKHCLFEPVHGSYPQAAGRDLANPLATILSVKLMMQYFGLRGESRAIGNAIDYCIENSILTEDLEPEVVYTCSQLGDVIHAAIIDKEGFNVKSVLERGSLII